MSTQMPLLEDPATGWRRLSNTHPIAMAVLAGFVGTHIATIFGFWFHGIFGLPDLDWPRFNGYLLFRPTFGSDFSVLTEVSDTTRLVLGWLVHAFTGIVFTITYVAVVHPRIPWPNTMAGNAAKALVWGGILATLSALWWSPSLFPEFDLGFFTWNLDKFAGVVAIYLWHAIYALGVSLVYNPLPRAS